MLFKLTASFSLCVLAQQADVEVTEMCPLSLLNLFSGYHAERSYLFIVQLEEGFYAAIVKVCQCWNFKLRYVLVDESFSAISSTVPVIDNPAEGSLCLFQSV